MRWDPCWSFRSRKARRPSGPGLKPEVLTSYQASWSHKWSPRLSTRTAGTLLKGEHAIRVGTDAGGLEQFQNAGEGRYVAGRENPATGTRVPANWTLRASVRREWGWGWAQVTGEDLTGSRRRDLVAPEYQPVTWMEGDGRAVRSTIGIRF